jgi:DNA-binding GntR family transcriptional regulator
MSVGRRAMRKMLANRPPEDVSPAPVGLAAALHVRAADRLRRMIVRGQLAAGTEITEAELCDRLGMSRSPLREAIKLLASEGLVELRRNRSARVTAINSRDVGELFETVACIEKSAVELAAGRISRRDLVRLERMQAMLERDFANGDLSAYFTTNHKVHQALVAACGNRVMIATHAQLLARVERARYFALGAQGRWEESIAEHRLILESLARGDGPRAGALLAEHVRRTGETVCALLDGLETGT